MEWFYYYRVVKCFEVCQDVKYFVTACQIGKYLYHFYHLKKEKQNLKIYIGIFIITFSSLQETEILRKKRVQWKLSFFCFALILKKYTVGVWITRSYICLDLFFPPPTFVSFLRFRQIRNQCGLCDFAQEIWNFMSLSHCFMGRKLI